MSSISPATIKRLLKELASIDSAPLEGITVLANHEDLTTIVAIIDGPQDTPYEGGHFRIKLKLGAEFPTAPPKGFFVTKIFHPNVSAKGEICVNTLKRDWSPALGVKHILLTIKCLLIVPNPESSLNDEAGKMLLERYEDYCSRARSWTRIHASSKKDREAVEAVRAQHQAATSSDATTPVADASATNVAATTLNKENSKSNDSLVSTANKSALESDAPVAKKPKAAAAAKKPAKKKINRRL